MTPYYQDDLVTIYHGDAAEVMSSLKRQTVDVILTDPPFFMPAQHYVSRVAWQRSWADTSILGSWWRGICEAGVPLLKATGHLFTFCDDESYPVFYPELYRRFDTLAALVWDKGHVGLGRVWRHQHELIIAARWADSHVNEDGVLRSDILKHKATPSAERRHPVEKPVALLADLITPSTPERGLVLDPFMGSGTTLEAAKHLGRRAIGVELEERYCEDAARRCSQEVLGLSA